MPQCPVCPKSFPSPYKLQRHYVIHTGQRPFICKICGKAFTQAEHLRTHLQKVQHSRLPTDLLQDGILTHNQQPNCSKPAAGIYTHGSSNITSITWTVSPPVASQPEWKREIVTHKMCLPSSETENPPKNMPHVNDGSVTQNSLSNVMDAIPQEPLTSHRTPVISSVEVELQCKMSVNTVQDLNKTEIKSDAVVKTEQPLNTRSQCHSICLKSDEQEQQYLTHKDLKPFQCMICNRSFWLEVNLIRHHKIHGNQKELGRPTTVQNSDNVSDSETIKPEPSHAGPIDLNIIVKPETWSEDCSDHNGSLPQDSELITSAEQQWETCHATSKQQRINTLHQCHTCLKCFPSVSKLQRHMMTHTGQRPFGCEMCGKRFRQKTHLRVHCRTHLWSRYHKQRSLYINRPPSCIGGFNTWTAADVPVQELLIHKKDIETHTGSDVISVKCQNDHRKSDNKLLPHTSKKNEVVHLRNVSKVTVKRTQTAKSMQNPGNVQHKCSQCLKCFPSASKLQRHEMVHTGLKPFQCLMCGTAFRQVSHLKTHERTHCERKPSKPVSQQGNIRKLKANSQQQLYPRVSVCIPPQKKSVNTDITLGNGVRGLLCTRWEMSIAKVNSLFKTKSTSNVTCKKRKLHTCRICFKNFVFPCKLSRHLVAHSRTRPHKCTLCSKTFTQRGHLKIHEYRCRQSNGISHYIKGEMMNTNHLHDKCIENLTNCTDIDVNAAREQSESHDTSVGHYSFTDGDLSYCSEPVDSEWLAVPEVGLQEENNESEKKQRVNCNQATDHYSYSFPSELAFEIDKLVQNQNMAAPPLSHHYEGSAHNVEVPCQPKGVTAISGSNKLLSDELVSSVVENQMQPDNYWCEPLTVFECDKSTASFNSENHLKQHICSTIVQPKMKESAQKNCCDICFKYFVSPSKLKRHYLIHTGQRPFRCDICGKTFTQSAHVRTHRLTH